MGDEERRRDKVFLETMLDTLDTGVVACGPDGSLTLFNRAARELHGQDPSEELPEAWAEQFDLYASDGCTLLTPEEIPLSRALRGEDVREAEMVIAPHGRPARTLVANAQAIVDADGSALGAVVAMQDITTRRRLESDLRTIGEVARMVAATPDARRAVVEATRELTGADVALLYEAKGQDLRATVAIGIDGDALPALPLAGDSATARTYRDGEVRFAADTEQLPGRPSAVAQATGSVSMLFQPVRLDAQVVGVLGLGWRSAVSGLDDRQRALAGLLSQEAASAIDRARQQRGLERAAHLDALTGLANRRSWDLALSTALDEAMGSGPPVSLALLDLNALKELNDRAGHAAGDDALCACASAWRDTLRPTDVLARLGGDEFGALLPNCDATDAAQVAEALRAATPHHSGVGIGLAQWRPGETAAEVARRADISLYEDKEASRGARLHDEKRLDAVRSALASSATAELDALAATAAQALAVPLVVVTLVDGKRQLFPGQSGLPAPWAAARETPLSHSFCQHVVTSGTPLTVDDARQDHRFRDNLAIGDLGVVGYAGVPLVGEDGQLLGALAAICPQPRSWTPEDVELLRGLVPTARRFLAPAPAPSD